MVAKTNMISFSSSEYKYIISVSVISDTGLSSGENLTYSYTARCNNNTWEIMFIAWDGSSTSAYGGLNTRKLAKGSIIKILYTNDD